jgi:Glycosyltransferase family 87
MKRLMLPAWLMVLTIVTLVLVHAVRRDIRYQQEYPGDLRNRVVGARLVEDGRDPYFYKWKKTDGIRYYDTENFIHLTMSQVTVTPFFLHLLRPFADWPEASINTLWLVLEYIAIIAITAVCFFNAGSTGQKQTVLLFSSLFLLTNGWKGLVNMGQYYIFMPLLAALFYSALRWTRSPAGGLLAGLLAAMIVLTRPNMALFVLPFLVLARRYNGRWLLAFGVAPLLLGGWILSSRQERDHWQNYSAMIREYANFHQHLNSYPEIAVMPDPKFPRWEGIDKPAADSLFRLEQDKFTAEQGNVFEIYRKIVHRQLPVAVLAALGIACMGVAVFFFYRRYRPFTTVPPENLALFAYCLYMLADFFSPVYRRQYNTVQWIFPLLLACATYRGKNRFLILLLFVGLLLNITPAPWLKMRATIGEYLWLVVLLLMAADPAPADNAKPLPAGVSAR